MKTIKKFFFRTWNAIKIFYMVWKNPDPINESAFRINQEFFEFVIRVQEENRPYFTRFGFIHPDGVEKPIVTIWAAPGTGGSPTERITDLVEENNELRSQIDQLIRKSEKN